MAEQLLTINEVAAILRKSPKEVRALPIPYSRIGMRDAIRYHPSDLMAAGYLEPPSPPHWVYFVGYGDKIKIGSARKPWKRFAELQCGSPVPLKMLGVMNGGWELEQELHARWAERRSNGEWFIATVEMREFIKQHAKMPERKDG